MTDLFATLPTETVYCILTYIDQKDCAECMSVCRRWYELFPVYTTFLWQDLTISPAKESFFWNHKVSNGMLQCLGPHVKNISIDSHNALAVLKRLHKRNCVGVKSIAISNHKVTRKRNGRLSASDKFEVPAAIALFAGTLTELYINSHPWDISLAMLLNNLPFLTHLSVHLSDDITDHVLSTTETRLMRRARRQQQQQCHEKSDDPNFEYHNNLIYLSLDKAFNFNNRICYVLRRCPKVKSLRITEQRARQRFYVPTNKIHVALKLCPSARNIWWNANSKPAEEEFGNWLQLSKSSTISNNINDGKNKNPEMDNSSNNSSFGNGDGPIQRLVSSGRIQDDLEEVMPILSRSQSQLEHLHLLNTNRSRHLNADFLANYDYYFSNLKSLVLTGINMTTTPAVTAEAPTTMMEDNTWTRFFSRHQDQLEQLTISLWFSSPRQLNKLISAISTLKQLRKLTVFCVKSFPDLFPGTCDNLDLLCTGNIKLQQLRLYGIPISDQGLSNLCCEHTQLRDLQIYVMETYRDELTDDGMMACADRLKVTARNGSNKIRQLILGGFQNLNDAALERFGQIDSLHGVAVVDNQRITDAGIKAYIGNSSNTSKNIVVYDCPGVTTLVDHVWKRPNNR